MSLKNVSLSSSGIEFHSLGAATANALSPYDSSLVLESPEGVERTILISVQRYGT